MDGNGMATGELTDAEVFGAQPTVAPAQPAPQAGNGSFVDAPTGAALNSAQTAAYQRLLAAGKFDPKAEAGTEMLPLHQTTEGEEPETGKFFVDLTGNVRKAGEPVTAAEPKELSDAEVFGAAGPTAATNAPADTRPVSETLGFGSGVNTVGKNLIETLSGKIPGLPDLGHPGGVNVMTLPLHLLQGVAQGQIDKASETKKPGLLGKVAGEIAATAPMASEALGAIPLGLLQGSLTSESKDPLGKIVDTASGAIAGKLGDLAVGGLKNIVSPIVRPAAKWAADHAISLTPGAIMGGAAAKAESVLSKLALVGPMVRNTQIRTVEDFNKATLNHALSPAGLALPADVAAGHAAVDAAHKLLSNAYNTVVPKLTVTRDPAFDEGVSKLSDLATNLSDTYAGKFGKVLDDQVLSKFDANGQMSGQAMRDADSYLGQQVRRFGKAQDPLANEYADALTELQSQLRDVTERSNPAQAGKLGAINSGWAQLVRVERAAGASATKGGVFTPDDLLRAIKATDSSARGSATARGHALLQDWANQAKEVVPSTMPKAGSPLDHLMEAMVTFGVGHEAGLPAIGKMLATEGALAGAYTKPGQKIATVALTKRPAVAKTVGDILAALQPVAAYGAATAAPKMLPALPSR